VSIIQDRTMNSLRLVPLASSLTLALLAGLPAQAQQDTQRIEVTGTAQPAPGRYTDAGETFVPFANPRTREDVRAELMAYLAAGGHVHAGDESGPPAPAFVSTKTRAEVMAEAAQSRANGEYAIEGDALVFRASAPTMIAGGR
jgi:hypothetical protein